MDDLRDPAAMHSPKRPTYRQRYHEAWVTVSPGRGRSGGGNSLPATPRNGAPPAPQTPTHTQQHGQPHPAYGQQWRAPSLPQAQQYGANGPPPAHPQAPQHQQGPPQGHPGHGGYMNPSHAAPAQAEAPINGTFHPHPQGGGYYQEAPNNTVSSIHSYSGQQYGYPEDDRLRRMADDLEKAQTDLDMERTRMEIEKKEAVLRLSQELEQERGQNVQSAGVISQQMTLIESLKFKVDELAAHSQHASDQHATELNDAREQANMQGHEARQLGATLQTEMDAKRAVLQQQEADRSAHEQDKVAWDKQRRHLEGELSASQDELAQLRSNLAKERRSAETLRREHTMELEDLLRQHEIEQQGLSSERSRHEQQLCQVEAEKNEMAQRVHDIQRQREEEARSLQREIEEHLTVVESLKGELRAKQQDLFEDWKKWRQQLTEEKQQLAERVQEERRDMEFKVAHVTQQVEAERRRLDVERSSVEGEWKQLREARSEHRQRDRQEWDLERERFLEQMRTRQADLEHREQRLSIKERSVDTTSRELEQVCRDKVALEAELHRLRVENAQIQELRQEKERWQRELGEQEEKWRQQLHEIRDRHHNKLEEQCKKHSDAIEMINRLRAQLAGRTGNEAISSPHDTAFLERKLQEMERKLMESEHALGQAEGCVTNIQAELTAADSRVRRSEEHIEELNRQILEYKQELTEARLDRESLRSQAAAKDSQMDGQMVDKGEYEAVLQERDHLVKDLHLAMLANREDKFVHLCDIHKEDGYEGLCRAESQLQDEPLDKQSSKAAYTMILTSLERIKQQPFVCAACVTEMHHSFDNLLRFLAKVGYASQEIHEAESVLAFLMALTSRLSEQGEHKIHATADVLLKVILSLE